VACVTSVKPNGTCGPYTYPNITSSGVNGNTTSVGNNMFTGAVGYAASTQTLTVTNPGDWNVVANLPAGDLDVTSYPSLGQYYGPGAAGYPLSHWSAFYSSFNETMNQVSGTSAEAAYDIWFSTTTGFNEVMIQHDIVNRGTSTTLATVSFGGNYGVPVHNWNLSVFNREIIWQLADDGGNLRVGSVDILAMLLWLENNPYAGGAPYLPASANMYLIGYGWEICSTNGGNETFQVNSFSMTDVAAGPGPGPGPSPVTEGAVNTALLWGTSTRCC